MKPKVGRPNAMPGGRIVLTITLAMAAMPLSLALAAAEAEPSLSVGGAPHVPCGDQLTGGAPLMVACDSGGEGATACETKSTINVQGFGMVSGCGISCTSGWYACCQNATVTKRASCSCEPDQRRGPWTPELLW